MFLPMKCQYGIKACSYLPACQIDKQAFGEQAKTLPPSNSKLNNESVNNNSTTPILLIVSTTICCSEDAVSFAKLLDHTLEMSGHIATFLIGLT
jgi:hypothetical protein